MKDRESDKNRQMRKESRRPDMELYKPGMGLWNKNRQKSNCNINSIKDDRQMRKESRRPDRELYKPGMGLWSKNRQKSNCNINSIKDDRQMRTREENWDSNLIPLEELENLNHGLSRENYYTSFTSHVTQEEHWDSNLIPLEELENLVRKPSELSDGKNSKNEHRATNVENEPILSSSEDSSFLYSPKIKDWSEELEANELEMLPVSDGSSTNIPDQDTKEGEKMKTENYYTFFTSHVTQEEHWDSNLIPLEELENLYISTKTFSQEDFYIVNNSKDCSKEKHAELQSVVSALSDGENSKNEYHATNVENQATLTSTEDSSFLYSPKIKDWSEEVEANELEMQPVNDAQCTNIPDPDTKEGEKTKTEIDDYKTKQEIPISSSYPPPPSTPVLGSYCSDYSQQDIQNQRWRLRLKYENIILADPHYEQNVEESLWKSIFYEGIEALRRHIDEDLEKKEVAKHSLIECIDEGTIFYKNLLEKQQEKFGVNFSQYRDVAKPQCIPDSMKVMLTSMQKTYVSLGDVARYREQASGKKKIRKFCAVRRWYFQAQKLAPENGLPYNQLAILSAYNGRKLDAAYYYIRSISAFKPVVTGWKNFKSLFEYAKRKYEKAEKKRREEKINYLTESIKSEREEKYEVWIHPDSSISKRTNKTEQDLVKDELCQMGDVDLNNRFITSFLHIHGELINNIGMGIDETAALMLMEFNNLLQRTPSPMSSFRLLQLLVINMFVIDNTSVKDQNLEPLGWWSPFQELAVQLGFTMITLLLERTVILLKEHIQSGDYPANLISEDLAPLLPAVKVWADWMSCQRPLWYPTPPPCNFKIGCKEDVWTSFAALLTVLRTVDTSGVEIISEPQEGYELLTLPEDATLTGFVLLRGAPEGSFYVKMPFDQERAKNYLRFSRIQCFGDYLCGLPSPYLEFDVEKKMFISLVSDISSEENTESGQDICYEMAVLQEHCHKRPTMLEVHPRYLLPDTNCFIDHLDGLKSLVNSSYFVLIVPTVVINELYGLARGTREGLYTSSERVKEVAQLSRNAVQFLEERFSVCDSRVKAITSKGSTLDTITFRSEDVSDNKGTNDDLILSCCLHYSKDKKDMIIKSEGPVRLMREAILLTEDKNLCIKALAHNIPVRDLPEFLKWANIE